MKMLSQRLMASEAVGWGEALVAANLVEWLVKDPKCQKVIWTVGVSTIC